MLPKPARAATLALLTASPQFHWPKWQGKQSCGIHLLNISELIWDCGAVTTKVRISKAYKEAVCKAYVAARAGFGRKPRPGQPRNSIESRNRSSLHGLRRRSRLFWRRTAYCGQGEACFSSTANVAAWACFGGACTGGPRPRLRSLRKLQRRVLGF